jgi:glycosyltransferase involved in cell wall biosynthesis
MKICYFADARPVRGPHLAGWVKYLTRNGHEVEVISFKSARIDNVKVHCIDPHRIVGRRTLYLPLSYKIWQARRIVNKTKPDILHGWDLGGSGLCAACIGYRPLVLTAYGWDVTFFPRRSVAGKLALNFALRRADAIASISDYLGKELRRYGPTGLPIRVVPWPVDINVFSPRRSEKRSERKGFVIAYTKRLDWYYGIEYFIQALPHIVREFPNTEVWLFGEGAYKARLRALVDRMGLENLVRFVGWVPHADMVNYLSEVDVVVIPSLQESWGVASLEAQSMEIPVVASNVGGLPETLRDGKTGFLVEPRRPDQIAEAVIRLLRDEELRSRMGRAAREFVAETYSWDVCGKKMLSLYESLI